MSIFELSGILSCLFTGLYAGSMLTEAGILVPYWKKMEPADFLRMHQTMAPSLFRFYAPLTVAGTLSPVVTLAVGLLAAEPITTWWWLAVVISLMVLGVYFGYFKSANKSFETGTSATAAAATLSTWATWHNGRTIGSVAAFLCCVVALYSGA